jgi:putative ABC transport system permease protein
VPIRRTPERSVALFRWFILRRLRQERLRSALTASGIALGIAVVVGIRLANASSVSGFATALESLAGAASLEIVGVAGVPERYVADLNWLGTFGEVAPIIEADATLETADGATETLRVLGIDILRDRSIRDYRIATSERAVAGSLDVLALLTEPDALVITAALAAKHTLRPGSYVRVITADTRRPFRIRGLVTGDGAGRQLDASIAVMDIATAQWAFGRDRAIDRLDIRLHPGRDVGAAERSIESRLPPGLFVQRPSRRGQQVEDMLRAFHFNLTALSYVALLVGLFLIYSTISSSVIARREEIGMLRALGARRRTVGLLFLTEAAALGLAGSVAGLFTGVLFAEAAVHLTARTVSSLYVATAGQVPPLHWTDAVLALVVGVVLSVGAAAAPVREASRVSPIAAIRGTDRIEVVHRVSLRVLGVGLGLLVLALVLSTLGPVNGLPVFGVAAAVCVIFGTSLVIPAVLHAFVRVSGRLVRRKLAVEALLAHASVAGSRNRLAVSIAALTASVSMLVAIAVMIGSFRETVQYWIGQTLQADVYVAVGGRPGLGPPATISSEAESTIRSHPAVASVEPIRSMTVEYGGRPVTLTAAHLATLRARGAVLFKSPSAPDLRDGLSSVVVSEPFAVRNHVGVGDVIRLQTPAGLAAFTIAAVYYDYTTDRGVIVIDWSAFRRLYGNLRATNLALMLRPGYVPDQVRNEIASLLSPEHRLFVHTSATIREEALRIFDRTFSVTYALEAIAILVGMLGVAMTLLTLIVERRRDVTTLRLLGAARAQIRRAVLLEAAVIGLISQTVGLSAGLALAVLLVYVINLQSFGWTIQFDVPVAFLVQASVALLLASLAAGLHPARVAEASAPDARERE